jgi:hypothetical protein
MNGVIVMTPPGLHQHRIIKVDGITMTIGDGNNSGGGGWSDAIAMCCRQKRKNIE